ncbi:hypothetical protein [uncultured Idiomarina sp.]|uniref:hypothetical protein n=1 Tax=uncultured Idiomarina sp. TaxID=352961 RepID=UPI0032B1437A
MKTVKYKAPAPLKITYTFTHSTHIQAAINELKSKLLCCGLTDNWMPSSRIKAMCKAIVELESFLEIYEDR